MTNKVKEHIGFHYLLTDMVVYFDSFEIECIPQEVLCKIKDKSATHNTFRIQDEDSIKHRFSCITFIEHICLQEKL